MSIVTLTRECEAVCFQDLFNEIPIVKYAWIKTETELVSMVNRFESCGILFYLENRNRKRDGRFDVEF